MELPGKLGFPSLFLSQMGYTHYWEDCIFTLNQWNELREIFQVILTESEVQKAQVTDEFISFKTGCETFELVKNGKCSFNFCKTQRNFGDALVVATLEAAAKICAGSFKWSSDGNINDLQEGLVLLRDCTAPRKKSAMSAI